MHIHTTASDGLWEPEKIISTAKKLGLKGIAITDHDTIAALDICNTLTQKYDIRLIPGIELSTDNNEFEIHILGYFVDYKNVELLKFLSDMQQNRINRAASIVNKLKAMGLDINMNEVNNEAGCDAKSIGRPHIARVLVKKGYFRDTGEVFKNLINSGKPAYVKKQNVSIQAAASIIKKAGGIPVFAHPFTDTGLQRGYDFECFINKIVQYGIMGIEVFHTMHSRDDEKYLMKIEKNFNLVVTGGSDFHGTAHSEVPCLGLKGISEAEFLKLKYL